MSCWLSAAEAQQKLGDAVITININVTANKEASAQI